MLLIGLASTELRAEERDWLTHPAVAGVVLFRRNFAARSQIGDYIAEIRATCPRPLLVRVDQEGGRVQRFTEGFTRLPPLTTLGRLFDLDPAAALTAARAHAQVMASEMRAIGVDISFAPVVDLGRGNRAIGDRALHSDPAVVAQLTAAYVNAQRAAGMAATLKHFPGHGSVLEDTHVDAARDPRSREQIALADLLPFRAGLAAGAEAVMAAHVIYPAVDAQPAGFSRYWLQTVLREQLGFGGAIFSDDIGMAAGSAVGGVAARIHAHLDAGCDAVLACHPALVPESLQTLRGAQVDYPLSQRLQALQGQLMTTDHGTALSQARATLESLSRDDLHA
mgnify:CR=1 FL=1